MANTSSVSKRPREVFYYRQRYKNRFFAALASFFAQEAKERGITKKEIAKRLNCDPSQVTRWLAHPSNLTLETISDLLLAMDAEPEKPRFIRFADKPKKNFVHPLIAQIQNRQVVTHSHAEWATSEGSNFLRSRESSAKVAVQPYDPDRSSMARMATSSAA